MSRAFVKETDDTVERLPDRPISSHPNLVTREGLEQIETNLRRLREEWEAAHVANDGVLQARIARDLRCWMSRKSSAQVFRAPKDAGEVHFGCTVIVMRDDGRQQTYRIVGEDEADPNRGTVSYISPLAQDLLGKRVGDVVRLGRFEAEILQIKPVSEQTQS